MEAKSISAASSVEVAPFSSATQSLESQNFREDEDLQTDEPDFEAEEQHIIDSSAPLKKVSLQKMATPMITKWYSQHLFLILSGWSKITSYAKIIVSHELLYSKRIAIIAALLERRH
jgi:hypothetical protein